MHYLAPRYSNSLESTMTFNFKTHWRTTTALCIASAVTLATTAYAANGGLSNWDMRSHSSRRTAVPHRSGTEGLVPPISKRAFNSTLEKIPSSRLFKVLHQYFPTDSAGTVVASLHVASLPAITRPERGEVCRAVTFQVDGRASSVVVVGAE